MSLKSPNLGLDSSASANRRLQDALLLLLAVPPAVFTLVTDNIREDFFITFRCGLNLLPGHGLVYETGRKVPAFTSPLGVLLPVGFSGLARTEARGLGMAIFRAAACGARGGAWLITRSRLVGSVGLVVCAGRCLWLSGRGYLRSDAYYGVWRRRPDVGGKQ